MKIIIVGGGISGLATYLFLKKHLPPPPPPEQPHEILIFESHKNPLRPTNDENPEFSSASEQTKPSGVVGSGLGVSPNGMRQLKFLSPEVRDEVSNHGYPVQRFQINNAHNWTLGAFRGDVERWGEKCVMIKRMDLWNSLRERVDKSDLSEGTVVTAVKKKEIEGTEKLVVVCKDAEEVEADMVIGADGVRSVVRDYVVEGAQAEYEGLLGVGGFMPSSFLPPLTKGKILRYPKSPVVMTFGARGFFGYGPCSSKSPPSPPTPTETITPEDPDLHRDYGPLSIWWSTYDSPTVPSDYKTLDHAKARQQLVERHATWKDPVIMRVIKEGSIDFLQPTYITPKLPRWSNGKVILIGDAAHALPSTSGQGVSQALEDAHSLSLLLAHFLQKAYSIPVDCDDGDAVGASSQPITEADAIIVAASKYEILRKPRVEGILDHSRKMGDKKKKKGFIEEWLVYLMVWLMCKFMPLNWLDDRYAYDVEAEVKKVVSD